MTPNPTLGMALPAYVWGRSDRFLGVTFLT